MADKLRLAVGIIGNAATISLYAAPILTFAAVVRKRSVGEFSCLPYTIALFNCLVYSWYGLPVVSSKWENFLLVPINGVGVLLELSFLLIYFKFSSSNGKKKVAILTTCVILAFAVTALLSEIAIHDHGHRKVLVGSLGLITSILMYSSPLVVVKQVIRTRSVEFMPFYLSLFTFLSSSSWLAFGLLSHDFLVAAPNMVGSPLGIFQLIVYCKYRRCGLVEEQIKVENLDEESNIKTQKILQELPLDKEDDKIDENKHMQHLQIVVTHHQ